MTQKTYKTVIIGLGETGLSVARYLAKKDVTFAVFDTRDSPPKLDDFKSEMPDVEIALGSFNDDLLNGTNSIIVSPGVPLSHPLLLQAKKQGIKIDSDIGIFCEAAAAPIIGVTGSNGKTTVITLLKAMLGDSALEISTGGNIGDPALGLLCDKSPDYYLLELSSFQLEATQHLKTKISSILNITPDHIDRHTDFDAYVKAKQRLYEDTEIVVFNRHDQNTYSNSISRKVSFGLDEPNNDSEYGIRSNRGAAWLCRGKERLVAASDLHFYGQHNLLNALATLAIIECLEIPLDNLIPTLKNFQGLPHRTNLIFSKDDINWYDDSKATNVGATLAALQSFSRKNILILGGQSKGADFSILREAILLHTNAVILLGEAAQEIEEALSDTVPFFHAQDMRSAVSKARELVRPGENVLLSPACASLDMYQDYIHRGNTFIKHVAEQSDG
ncbi:MAG: UDP-N-acetylmuramoyl-L-alanine--D-glutamate ligase [Pseudomonadota bacterium]